MKVFVTVSTILAFVGLSICQNICIADDVINSLTAVEHYADKMQSVTDSSGDNIDPSAFVTSQLGYLHVADGRTFYEKNGHGDNAVKMRGYILQEQQALENYTTQVKAAAASCVDRIETAYAPLGTQLQKLLEAYPGMD